MRMSERGECDGMHDMRRLNALSYKDVTTWGGPAVIA